MSLTLERFYTVAAWDWIPPGTAFVLRTADGSGGPALWTEVALPAGNPRLPQLAGAIAKAAAAAGATCAYEPRRNRFVLGSEYGLQLEFPSLDVARMLGFDELLVGPGATLTSTHAIRPLPVDAIAVHVAGVRPSPAGHNLTNTAGAGAHLQPCSVLGVIPVDVAPYTVLDWANTAGSFTMVLADASVSSLAFSMTDWAGAPLRALGQHYLTLRVDTHARPGGTQRLLQGVAADVRGLSLLQVAKAAERGL